MTSDVSTFGFICGGNERVCMEHPDLVQSRLEGERVVTQVGLGGGDAVLVTPSRTIVYRAEGLLSDESVSAYPHDVERVELRSGRRKTTFRLAYVDGVKDFTVPSVSTHEVLVPVLTGVLRTAGVVDADETVRGAYRFSELTLVVTDRRVVKHVGGAVWDEEFEIARYAYLTGLGFEEGSVATEISIEVDGYPQRVKVPNEHAGTVRRTIQEAVFEFHGVSSLPELEAAVSVEADEPDEERSNGDVLEESGFTELLGDRSDDDESEERGGTEASVTATDGTDEGSAEADADPFGTDERGGGTILDPVRSGTTGEPEPPEDSVGGTRTGDAGGRDLEPASDQEVPPEVAERLDELTAAVEHQSELLEHQGEVIRQLIEELRRGR